MAGVIISANGAVASSAVTSTAVRAADHLQFALDEAPGPAAIRGPNSILIDDTDTDRRWLRWGPRAAQMSIQSILSTPMREKSNAVGSLNL